MLEAVVALATARKQLDEVYQSGLTEAPGAEHFVVLALEHADKALDAALLAALASGLSIEEIEAAAEITVVKPEWFDGSSWS